MTATNSAIGIDASIVTVGDGLIDTATASSTATAAATSVKGIATGNAVSTQDVGVLDSTLNVGGNGGLTVNETGVVTGSATTVNALNETPFAGVPIFDGLTDTFTRDSSDTVAIANGDRILADDGTGVLVPFYVTNYTEDGSTAGPGDDTFQLALTPGGTAVKATVLATSSPTVASSSFAGFTGTTGGIIDSSATGGSDTNDVIIGAAATVGVNVDNTATSTSTNVDGGSGATAYIKESYGLYDVGVQAGSTGSLITNVDANAVASATTVGGTTVATGANADSAATITDAVGINVSTAGAVGALSNITFGDGATISATAGTSADKIQVSAASTSTTGNATAVSTLGDAVGINTIKNDSQSLTASDLITVGNDATISGLGYADVKAAALTTNGVAVASAETNDTSGIEAGTIVVGDGGQIQTQAGITSTVSAATTGTTLTGTGTDFTATASNWVKDTNGLDVEKLTVGGDATKSGGYGILGRTDATLSTTASTVGNYSATSGTNTGDLDKASATGLLGTAVGIQIGDTLGAENGLTVGNNASIAGVANTANAATANSVQGEVDARATSTTVQGINLTDAAVIGGAATVLGQGLVDTKASAITTGSNDGADADASAGAGAVAGIQLATADATAAGVANTSSIGTSAAITGNAQVLADSTATSVTGTSTATAGGTFTPGSPTASAGTAGNDLNLVGVAFGNQLDATAVDTVTIGTNATITATAADTLKATATSTAESAIAKTQTKTSAGLVSEVLTVGDGATVSANSTLKGTATATTVGNLNTGAGAGDVATANSNVDSNVGADLDFGATTFGGDGNLTGVASTTNDATATATKADSTAGVAVATNTGIDLGDPSITTTAQTLTVGDAGIIGGQATGANTATATTVDGDAIATIAAATTSGLGDGLGILKVGNGAGITGVASVTNTATAASTVAASVAVEALVDNDIVQGINLTSITAGNAASVAASASSIQAATASNIGTPAGTDEAAIATVGKDDQILGIDDTKVTVGSDATRLTAGATLTGTAIASNVSGISEANAGVHSDVFALNNGSTVIVGGSATNGMTFAGVSNLTGTATSVEDSATAYVGSDTVSPGANPTLAGTATLQSTVVGVNTSDITTGNNAGTINATAASTLNATASTTGNQASTATNAIAVAAQQADGLLNSVVLVGNDGNLNASSTLVGNAAATNVGDVDVDDAAKAYLTLDSAGITQAGDANPLFAQDITIGDTGSVTSSAFVSGSGIAQSTSGDAEAGGDLDATAISLGQNSDITIGGAGGVTGTAVIGTLNSSGNLGNQVQITAATTNGTATASSDFDATGILGASDNKITVGPNGGNVRGQAIAGGNVLASSTGDVAHLDDANATINPSDLFGIKNIDIVGGQVGTNSVLGTSVGTFDATASSIYGDSTASSDVSAQGIFSDAGTADTISVSGGITAIAQLTNNVIANSVYGSATATATGDAVGLSGYHVTIIGSGSLHATALSTSNSIASSVAGHAGA